MLIIDDSTNNDQLYIKDADGKWMQPGYDPTTVQAVEGFGAFNDLFGDAPNQIKLIDPSEYDAYIDEQEARKSALKHRIAAAGSIMAALDQNGQGYCWAYSTGYAVMCMMMLMNRKIKRVSPHAIACKLMNFQDRGGWCGFSAKAAQEMGYPSQEFWPQQSMSRQNDNERTWADAALNKITGMWYDTARQHYNQFLTDQQICTLLLMGIPVPADFMWWGHSICLIGLERVERGVYGKRFMNSYSPTWGEAGQGVLTGSRARADNAVALYDIMA